MPGTDNGRGEKVSHPDDPLERSAGANFTDQELEAKAGDFRNWLQQPEGRRLLVATLRRHQNVEERGQGTSQSEKDQLTGNGTTRSSRPS